MNNNAETRQSAIQLVSGSAFSGTYKCESCDFEGQIAKCMEEWETGEYFHYSSSDDTLECPNCGNTQHYR